MEDFLLGAVMLFPYNFVPQGWHLCDGSLLEIQSNPALYSLIGTSFGGDGRTTFGLPNLNSAECPISKNGTINYCICMQGVYPMRP
ncbi:MAG: phage tail protein [Treponema sp.]|nr:phage tail protein [Treponema sp.]